MPGICSWSHTGTSVVDDDHEVASSSPATSKSGLRRDDRHDGEKALTA